MRGWIIERRLRSGRVVYDIGYRINGRSVRRKGGDTRAAADDALAIALADIAKGRLRGHATDDLATYAMRWLERRSALVEPGTLAGYRNDVLWRLIPTLGIVRLRHLTAEKIEAAVAEMREMTPRRGSPNATYSAKTINNTLTTLAVILGTAVSDGLLVENPCVRHGGAGARRLRIRDQYREMRYLMPEQIPVFLAACDPDEYAELAAVLALGGLRISEALALEPRDVDTRVGMIRVCRQVIDGTRSQLKDKTPRPVEIGRRLADQLERRIAWCRASGVSILFPEPEDGEYLDRTKIRKRWHIPALLDAGLDPRLRIHDLRHTAAAAWLIAGGQSLEYVRRQLGHASITQTQRYAHLERAGRSQAADLTEASIWGA
jgi:integrase